MRIGVVVGLALAIAGCSDKSEGAERVTAGGEPAVPQPRPARDAAPATDDAARATSAAASPEPARSWTRKPARPPGTPQTRTRRC